MNTLVTILASCGGVIFLIATWIALRVQHQGGKVKLKFDDGQPVEVDAVCFLCFAVWCSLISTLLFLLAARPQWITGL
jgi:hypothetical protein